MLDPSCRDFKSALLGLVASMIHDLAVSVFEHLHGSKYSNKPHPGVERPTLPDFRHSKYLRARSYPRGPIELVGYWMETRIFGGVVVFEHGNPPGEVCKLNDVDLECQSTTSWNYTNLTA